MDAEPLDHESPEEGTSLIAGSTYFVVAAGMSAVFNHDVTVVEVQRRPLRLGVT